MSWEGHAHHPYKVFPGLTTPWNFDLSIAGWISFNLSLDGHSSLLKKSRTCSRSSIPNYSIWICTSRELHITYPCKESSNFLASYFVVGCHEGSWECSVMSDPFGNFWVAQMFVSSIHHSSLFHWESPVILEVIGGSVSYQSTYSRNNTGTSPSKWAGAGYL